MSLDFIVDAVGSGRVRETKRFLNGIRRRKPRFPLRKTGSFKTEGRWNSSVWHLSHSPKFHFGDRAIYLPWFSIIIARTFMDRPNRLMKPSASLWLYSSPVVKEARDSLYRL